MTTNERKNEPIAQDHYAKARNDIARLIDWLQMELDAHAQRAEDKPFDWGYVGELNMVQQDLMNTLAAISGNRREDIQRLLDEAI